MKRKMDDRMNVGTNKEANIKSENKVKTGNKVSTTAPKKVANIHRQ